MTRWIAPSRGGHQGGTTPHTEEETAQAMRNLVAERRAPAWGTPPPPPRHIHYWMTEHALCVQTVTLHCATCGATTTGCRYCEQPIDADTTCPCTTEVNGL